MTNITGKRSVGMLNLMEALIKSVSASTTKAFGHTHYASNTSRAPKWAGLVGGEFLEDCPKRKPMRRIFWIAEAMAESSRPGITQPWVAGRQSLLSQVPKTPRHAPSSRFQAQLSRFAGSADIFNAHKHPAINRATYSCRTCSCR